MCALRDFEEVRYCMLGALRPKVNLINIQDKHPIKYTYAINTTV
jgi:hypothetical protein